MKLTLHLKWLLYLIIGETVLQSIYFVRVLEETGIRLLGLAMIKYVLPIAMVWIFYRYRYKSSRIFIGFYVVLVLVSVFIILQQLVWPAYFCHTGLEGSHCHWFNLGHIH